MGSETNREFSLIIKRVILELGLADDALSGKTAWPLNKRMSSIPGVHTLGKKKIELGLKKFNLHA